MIDEFPVSVGVVTRSQSAALRQSNSPDLSLVPDPVSTSESVPLNVIVHSDDLVDVVLSSTDELISCNMMILRCHICLNLPRISR